MQVRDEATEPSPEQHIGPSARDFHLDHTSCMNEPRRRPPRRGRGTRPSSRQSTDNGGDDNPYRESSGSESPSESMESVSTNEPVFERPAPEPPPPTPVELPPAAATNG